MFKGNNTNPSTKNMDMNAPDKLNRIVQGTTIQGEIKAESNLRIDGVVLGQVTTKGRLVIGTTGKIEGDIKCQNADVEGEILGTIRVEQLLSLKSTAKLNGEITTKKLAIEPGAEFSGNCHMGNALNKSSVTNNKEVTVEEILKDH